MKIAFTSTGTSWDSMIDPRLGRTEFIVIFDEETNKIQAIDNSSVKNEAHGAGSATAQKLIELSPDIIITGNGPGETAAKLLLSLNLKIYINANNLSLEQAYNNYKNGLLKEL